MIQGKDSEMGEIILDYSGVPIQLHKLKTESLSQVSSVREDVPVGEWSEM